VSRQLYVLRLLLKYLKKISTPGTIVDIDMTTLDNGVTTSPEKK
jgi:hypothetical protein